MGGARGVGGRLCGPVRGLGVGMMKPRATEGFRETLNWLRELNKDDLTGGNWMAYPEPTPILRGSEAKDFLRRLKAFELTPEQKEFWRGALAGYHATVARSQAAAPEKNSGG